MPNYFYECKNCEHISEISMSIKDFLKIEESPICTACNSSDTYRVFKSFSNKVERSKEEILEKAKKDAKKIVNKIRSGDIRTIRNIYGEN